MLSAKCLDAGEAIAYFSTVDVLDRDQSAVSRALAWLTAAERDRYDRFRADGDRRMFLLGRVMARALVGAALGIAPDAWQWRDSSRGRPEIAAPETPLQFNLSHSAGLVACALASGRAVGVDVEHLRRRPVDRSLVRRYCSPAEAADIEASADVWLERFLHYWTLKEAYLKARGIGVSVPLADIEFRPATHMAAGETIGIAFLGTMSGADDRWAFMLTQPTDEHILAVAVERGDGGVRVGVEPMPVGLLP
jgi:4'-phosphopantetheinyl transferase